MANEVKETTSGGELLYDAAMGNLIVAEKYPVNSTERMNYLLEAIAHALLASVRDGLDYSAKQPPGTLPPEPFIEEDDTRP